MLQKPGKIEYDIEIDSKLNDVGFKQLEQDLKTSQAGIERTHNVSQGLAQVMRGDLTGGIQQLSQGLRNLPDQFKQVAFSIGAVTAAATAGWTAGKRLDEWLNISGRISDAWNRDSNAVVAAITAQRRAMRELNETRFTELLDELSKLSSASERAFNDIDRNTDLTTRSLAAMFDKRIAEETNPEKQAALRAEKDQRVTATKSLGNQQAIDTANLTILELQVRIAEIEDRFKAASSPSSGVSDVERQGIRKEREDLVPQYTARIAAEQKRLEDLLVRQQQIEAEAATGQADARRERERQQAEQAAAAEQRSRAAAQASAESELPVLEADLARQKAAQEELRRKAIADAQSVADKERADVGAFEANMPHAVRTASPRSRVAEKRDDMRRKEQLEAEAAEALLEQVRDGDLGAIARVNSATASALEALATQNEATLARIATVEQQIKNGSRRT